MVKLQYLFFLFVFPAFSGWGQVAPSDFRMDSGLTYRYHHKYESPLYSNNSEAQPYLDSLALLSKNKRFPKASYYYYKDLGAYSFAEHHLANAEKQDQQAYYLAIRQRLKREAILANIWLANLDFLQGDFRAAETKYLHILSESKQQNFIDGIANAFTDSRILRKTNNRLSNI